MVLANPEGKREGRNSILSAPMAYQQKREGGKEGGRERERKKERGGNVRISNELAVPSPFTVTEPASF